MLRSDAVCLPACLQTHWKVVACAVSQNVCGLLIGYAVSVASGFEPIFHRTLAFELGEASQPGPSPSLPDAPIIVLSVDDSDNNSS